MHRVLLADDDTIVRLYLTDIVNWKQYDMEVVGAARDGMEALEMIHRMEPDIVLTDISMPKMDGVELIRQIRSEGFDGVVDVLSCHDDFELVKNAMKEGADDYLLKNHLNDRSVTQILEKIHTQIHQREKKTMQHQELRSLASRGLKSIQREFLIAVLRGTLTEDDLEDKLKEAGLHGKYRRLMTVCIRPLDADREQVESLLTLCDQRMKHENAEILYLHDDILVMLIDLTDEPSAQKAEELKNRLQMLIRRLAEQYLNLQTAMASSGICDGKSAIADALRQANETMSNSFYGGGCWQYGVDPALQTELPRSAVQFAQLLPELLTDAGDEEIRSIYEQALDSIREERVLPGMVIEWLRECDTIAQYRRSEAQYTAVRCWENCLGFAEDYLTVRMQKQDKKIPENVSPTIRRAIQYMYANFDKPIGLTQVSQHVHLSSAYFSTVFKQEMNVGFSEFLLTIRMEWVCQQLTTTSFTIKQISSNAGFPDYPYFCKTFKKMYGISPAAYRKEHS